MPPIEENDNEIATEVVVGEDGNVIQSGTEEQPESSLGEPTPEHDDDDESEVVAEEGEDRASIQARRREERKRRKNAQRAREEGHLRQIEALGSQLQEVTGRLMAVERHGMSSQVSQVDHAINETKRVIAEAQADVSSGVALGDGSAVAEAIDRIADGKMRLLSLEGHKKRMTDGFRQQAAPTTPERPATQQAPSQAVQKYAKGFMERHAAWYDPMGGNAESQYVLVTDNGVRADGFDPETKEYWDELESRLKNILPHRIKANYNGTRTRESVNTPVAPSSREGGSNPGKPKGYTLSADRVLALKETGAWFDPVRRAKAIAEFKKYDSEKGGAA